MGWELNGVSQELNGMNKESNGISHELNGLRQELNDMKTQWVENWMGWELKLNGLRTKSWSQELKLNVHELNGNEN